MINYRIRFAMPTGLQLLTALVAAAGISLAELFLLGAPWSSASWLLVGNLVLVGLAMALAMLREVRAQLAVKRQLDWMCSTRNDELRLANAEQRLPVLSQSNPWEPALAQVREYVHDVHVRLQQAEQQRSNAEIRARRLRSEWEQLSIILSGLPDPVLVINHYDEMILANLAATALFQIGLREPKSERLEDIIECRPLVELMKEVRRRKTPTQKTAEIDWKSGDGETRWYRIACRNLESADDEGENSTSGGAVAVLSDITSQKAMQKRNAEFVSAVSHEMKTPLSGIKAYVELLEDGDAEDDETRDEFLGVINSQADRLKRLIDNLLNLARIEAGVVNVNKEHESLNEVLEEAFGVLQPNAEQKQIQLVLDLSPLYLGVVADRDLLLQAAINLMSNAIKYTNSGGQVTLRSRSAASDVVFEVEDTGVGLSEEDCERVFEKFYRVRSAQQMAPGTGLGLPLAKYIVEDVHGGRLTVSSVLGQGSRFAATIPGAGQLHG